MSLPGSPLAVRSTVWVWANAEEPSAMASKAAEDTRRCMRRFMAIFRRGSRDVAKPCISQETCISHYNDDGQVFGAKSRLRQGVDRQPRGYRPRATGSR